MRRTATHMPRLSRRLRILDALKAGPMAAEPLAAAADTAYADIGKALAALLAAGSIVILGTASELGMAKRRNDARIYALPGTPKPQPVRRRREKASDRVRGDIAGRITIGRGSRWGAGLA